jgi:hypothetical protein
MSRKQRVLETQAMIATRTFAATVLSFLLFATSANADPLEHIDELSFRLQKQVGRLGREFRTHYRHTAHYRHLMSDTLKMYRLAIHIHDIAHHEGDLDHIHDDLHELDGLFHHVQELTGHTQGHADHDPFTGGHVHGHTGHVFGLLEQIEDTLHHMLEDVEELTGPGSPFPGGGFGGQPFGP